MKTIQQALVSIIAVFCTASCCQGYALAQSCGQVEYRLLATSKASTAERELNDAAKQGFKIELVAQSIGLATYTVLMARPGGLSSPSQQYEYRLLDAKQFEKRQEEMSTAGYLLRGSVLPSAFAGNIPVFLFERKIGVAPVPPYRLIAARKEAQLQNRLTESAAAGFAPVGIFSVVLMMQKRDLPPDALEPEYKLLQTYKTSTLESEMNAEAGLGFRFVLNSQVQDVLMARDTQAKEQAHYEYRFAKIRASDESVQELNELSRQGFVLRAVTEVGLVAIMERESSAATPPKRREFKVLKTRAEATMQKEIQDACAQGFSPLSMSGGSGAFITLVGREI